MCNDPLTSCLICHQHKFLWETVLVVCPMWNTTNNPPDWGVQYWAKQVEPWLPIILVAIWYSTTLKFVSFPLQGSEKFLLLFRMSRASCKWWKGMRRRIVWGRHLLWWGRSWCVTKGIFNFKFPSQSIIEFWMQIYDITELSVTLGLNRLVTHEMVY